MAKKKLGISCDCFGKQKKTKIPLHGDITNNFGCSCTLSNQNMKSKRGGKAIILGNNIRVTVTKKPKGSRRSVF